jgi:hypothetical protein
MVLRQAFHSSEHPSMNRSKSKLSFAFVHHANQFLITNGYENRSGISDITGSEGSKTGMFKMLDIHRKYLIPLNIHISGTLLESLAWHCPEFLDKLKSLARLGLLELIGSSYGQNMMKFFSREHNLRQLNEHLLLYENLLGWNADRVKVFWVPERLWDTSILAPILSDRELRNGGYKYVILDDRLLYSSIGNPSPRRNYDKNQTWDPKNFLMYEIEGGSGLSVVPIANNLRQNIPPRCSENLTRVITQLMWLFDFSTSNRMDYITIYADDMEKAAGIGWDPDGPVQYEEFVKWISTNKQQLDTVKIGEWASEHSAFDIKNIERGTYVELMNDFGAGESFDSWYYDPRWTNPYQRYYDWAETRVLKLSKLGADPDLIELAWKVLLATSWQTAWHTPKMGAHGDPNSDGGPSAWIKATASHSRTSAIIAEAARWMKIKDDACNIVDVDLQDIDQDGNPELIFKNNFLYSVFSPLKGGRLLYLFSVKGANGGHLLVGNPADDWNLLEDLHEYMDWPPNHPGAFADVGYEHDRFEIIMIEKSTSLHLRQEHEGRITLRNVQENSKAFGLRKSISLEQNLLRVDYCLPPSLAGFSTEIGISPDYLQLLRYGQTGVIEFDPSPKLRSWSNKDPNVWVKHDNHESGSVFWDNPRQSRFGHGYTVRITSHHNQFFSIWIGVESGSSC